MKHWPRSAAIAAVLLWITGAALAQGFPAKAVHIMVPFPPGGSADLLARILADPLAEGWGKPVIVDNRPGASTIIGAEAVARSPADGHTLFMNANSFIINQILRSNLPYNAAKDFVPVTLLVTSTQVIVVNASSAIRSFQELLDAARARPGQLSYATVGPATTQHIAGEMLRSVARIDLIYVPFPGGAPAVNAILGNHVVMVIANYSEVSQQLAAGRLRPVAVTSLERYPALRDVPTVAESGFKDFEATVWFGILAPGATPKETVARIQASMANALGLPAVRAKLGAQGMDPVGSTPQQYAAHMSAQLAKYAKVITEAGIKAE
jgi:tripartite-type tricarboxylate transporter receptor subunit TctC